MAEKLNISELTKEQETFLAECEKEFANRYTDDEADFKKICEAPHRPPPIIDPWYNKPRRNFDWSRQRDGGGGSRRRDFSPYKKGRHHDDQRYHQRTRHHY